MATPCFRASQATPLPSFAHIPITLPRLEIAAQRRFDELIPKRFYEFTHLTVETADPYEPPMPSVWRIVRMVAVPQDEKKNVVDVATWFSIHVYWDVIVRTGKTDNGPTNVKAIVDLAYKRVSEYLVIHPYPAHCDELDPLVLEIW